SKRPRDLVSARKPAVAAVANRTASVVAAETVLNQNLPMIHRHSTAPLGAESAATETAPNPIRPTAASNHRPVAAAAAKVWSPEARQASPAILQPAWRHPEYRRPASLPQKFGCRLGSVS